MSENCCDVIEVGRRDGLLGLDYFHGCSDARIEALPREAQGFARQLLVITGNVHLTTRRFKIQEGRANVAFDPAFQIFEFRLALVQRSVGLLNRPFCPSALPNGDAEAPENRERAMSVGRILCRSRRNQQRMRAKEGVPLAQPPGLVLRLGVGLRPL